MKFFNYYGQEQPPSAMPSERLSFAHEAIRSLGKSFDSIIQWGKPKKVKRKSSKR